MRWGAGCTFLDYDRDGHLDLVCLQLSSSWTRLAIRTRKRHQLLPVERECRSCAVRVGLPGDTNILYHNNGDGSFTDVSETFREF